MYFNWFYQLMITKPAMLLLINKWQFIKLKQS